MSKLVSLVLILWTVSWMSPLPTFGAEESNVFVTFWLVPEGTRGEEDDLERDDILPDGTIWFYQQGDYSPTLSLSANQRHQIPFGVWNWIAEADGYVSISSGVIKNRKPLPEAVDKRLVWDLVPACELHLEESPGWSEVERLDVVSLDRGAVIPVLPEHRRSLWVPTGRNLVYSVVDRQLAGFRLLEPCEQIDDVALEPPAPPAADMQDLMVGVVIPEGLDPVAAQVFLESATAAPVPATAGVWAANQGTFFFLSVPAEPMQLVVRHPELQDATLSVEPASGSARELPTLRPAAAGQQ